MKKNMIRELTAAWMQIKMQTVKLIGCKIPRHSSPSERMLTARHSCYSHILPPLNHSKQLVCFCSVSSPDVTSHIPLVWLPGSCVRVAWAPPIIHFSCRTRAFQNVSVLCSVPQRKVNGYLFFPHFFKKKKRWSLCFPGWLWTLDSGDILVPVWHAPGTTCRHYYVLFGLFSF